MKNIISLYLNKKLSPSILQLQIFFALPQTFAQSVVQQWIEKFLVMFVNYISENINLIKASSCMLIPKSKVIKFSLKVPSVEVLYACYLNDISSKCPESL